MIFGKDTHTSEKIKILKQKNSFLYKIKKFISNTTQLLVNLVR